tara:strand:+ start:510 stop:710 length:201 start_codon:yes stop_codon:yes gene_type:complete
MSNASSENLFDSLRNSIRVQMNEMSDHIGGGGCSDFSEYSKCCGIIQGLAMAERELLDLKERYEKV